VIIRQFSAVVCLFVNVFAPSAFLENGILLGSKSTEFPVQNCMR